MVDFEAQLIIVCVVYVNLRAEINRTRRVLVDKFNAGLSQITKFGAIRDFELKPAE